MRKYKLYVLDKNDGWVFCGSFYCLQNAIDHGEELFNKPNSSVIDYEIWE